MIDERVYIYEVGHSGVPKELVDLLTIPSHIDKNNLMSEHPLKNFVRDTNLIPKSNLHVIVLDDYKAFTGRDNSLGMYASKKHRWASEGCKEVFESLKSRCALDVSNIKRAIIIPQGASYSTLMHEFFHDMFNTLPLEEKKLRKKTTKKPEGKRRYRRNLLPTRPKPKKKYVPLLKYILEAARKAYNTSEKFDAMLSITNSVQYHELEFVKTFVGKRASYNTFSNLSPKSQIRFMDEFLAYLMTREPKEGEKRFDRKYISYEFQQVIELHYVRYNFLNPPVTWEQDKTRKKKKK